MLSFCRGKEKGMNRIMTYLIAGIMITIMAAVLLLDVYFIACVIIEYFQYKKYGKVEKSLFTERNYLIVKKISAEFLKISLLIIITSIFLISHLIQ